LGKGRMGGGRPVKTKNGARKRICPTPREGKKAQPAARGHRKESKTVK